MKTFRKPTCEMETPTLKHGNPHKIWNLRWKLSEIKIFKKRNLKRKLSELNTIRKNAYVPKSIVLKWNFQLSEMNAWIRSQHKHFFFQDEVLDCTPTAQSPSKAPQASILQSDLSPKKTLNQNCDLGAPLFEDVWTMFQWQNVEGFFQLFILKKWVHIDAEYMRQAAAMPPQSSPTHPKSKMRKATKFFFRGCFKPQFSIFLSPNLFH